jgi:hypothetical protein
MGRGRAKAKQTKVARELKYSSLNTDFDALQRELAGTGDSTEAVHSDLDDDEDDSDLDEDDDWSSSR